MEVTQKRQTKAVQVGPASREFNGDLAKHAGSTQYLAQHFARRRLLQGPDDSGDQATKRAQGMFVISARRERSSRA